MIVPVGLIGCGDDDDDTGDDTSTETGDDATSDDDDDASGDVPVAIKFEALTGGVPFKCGAMINDVGSTKAKFTFSDYRFYVHDVRLVTAGGFERPVTLDDDGKFQADGLALMDFEDASGSCAEGGTPDLHTTLTGKAPDDDYAALRFKVGVPYEKNHADAATAAAPLNLTSMFWIWQSGYKFIRIDGAVAMGDMRGSMHEGHDHGATSSDTARDTVDDTESGSVPATDDDDDGGHGGATGFFVHLGSTGCASDAPTSAPAAPCANPNVMEVEITDFTLGSTVVVTDAVQLLKDVDVKMNTPDTAPGCMSAPNDPECTTIFAKLGLAIGSNPAGKQSFFTAK